jgi:hypothetical protein
VLIVLRFSGLRHKCDKTLPIESSCTLVHVWYSSTGSSTSASATAVPLRRDDASGARASGRGAAASAPDRVASSSMANRVTHRHI